MNRTAIVCKTDFQHLLTKRSGKPKHCDQLEWFVQSCSCHRGVHRTVEVEGAAGSDEGKRARRAEGLGQPR